MSELNVINESRQLNTIVTLISDFKKLGIQAGDTLLVHSSLKSLGWVNGAASTVIRALLEVLGENGTLVMPTHSGDLSDPAQWQNPPVPQAWWKDIYETMPAFDIHLTETRGMGRIPELFRNLPGVRRSFHPQLSFAAYGKHAEFITNNHPLTPSLGMESPLGKLYQLKAKVLLLGVGYDSCTSFHLAECLIPQMPIKRFGTPYVEDGQRIWKWFEDFDVNNDDFPQLGEEFEKNFPVTIGQVGQATCRLFPIVPGVDFAKQWITKHRF